MGSAEIDIWIVENAYPASLKRPSKRPRPMLAMTFRDGDEDEDEASLLSLESERPSLAQSFPPPCRCHGKPWSLSVSARSSISVPRSLT
jgi:hypothetical protein